MRHQTIPVGERFGKMLARIEEQHRDRRIDRADQVQ